MKFSAATKNHPQIVPLLGLLLVGILGIIPLLHPGLFTAHDIWHQVARLYHYSEVIRAGSWPPGWVMTLANGYGYPLFYFSYHLPWMIGAPLVLAGVSIPITMKILFGGAFIAAGYAMYWLVYLLTGKRWPAFVAAAIYIIAPYHFLAVYVAAAIGTVFQFIWIPLVGVGMVYNLRAKPWLGISILAIAFAGSVLTHLMSTAMFMPFLALWIVLMTAVEIKTDLKRWLGCLGWYLLTGLLSLGLAAFYLVPLFQFKPLIISDSNAGFSAITNSNFVSLKQLVYSRWGFGPIVSNAKDEEISLQVGVAQWLAAGLSFVLITLQLARRLFPSKRFIPVDAISQWCALNINWRLVISVLMFLLTVICMLDVSHPFWQAFKLAFTPDYPWRLLLLSVFFGSLAAGQLLVDSKKTQLATGVGILLLLSALYANRNHVRVNLYTDIAVEDYVDAEKTTNTFAEYLPKTAQEDQMKTKSGIIVNPLASSEVIQQSAIQEVAKVTVPEDGIYALRQYAFPTLVVTVDDREVTTDVNSEGLLTILLTRGEHLLRIAVIETVWQQMAKLLSALSAIFVVGAILYETRNKARNERRAKS